MFDDIYQLLLFSWVLAAVLMLVFWLIQRRTSTAGIVDIVWAFVTAILATLGIIFYVEDASLRQYLLISLIGLWGVRLGVHLAKRIFSEGEDGRYQAMKGAIGQDRVQAFMFGFFQLQALWAVMFAAPVVAAGLTHRGEIDWLDILGLGIFLIALIGEWVADKQLADFRSQTKNKGKVCNLGLWRYSRHPNYFFEWLHWWAYVAIGVGSPYWWVTWAGVIIMYLFLNYVTGIPFTEQQALRSRGENYRDYQKTTSRFFLFPPRLKVNLT